jgi:protein TonB
MAYLETPPLKHRLASLGTAGAIEVAIGVALIAGLTTTLVPDGPPPRFIAEDFPTAKPPPPDPQPTAAPRDSVVEVPTPPDVLDNTPEAIPTTAADDWTALPDLGEVIRNERPRVEPSPRFTPVGATPRNDPSNWVTTEDYPARDLREGNQGTTRFRVVVGSNGRVQACDFIQSSGFASLDKAACDNVKRRARFDAATDGNGAKVVGTYTSSVVWRIPSR